MNNLTNDKPAHKAAPEHEGHLGELRKVMAATIVSGLVAVHGIDAGGVDPSVLAKKALAIADAICDAADEPAPEQDEDGDDIPVKE